MEAEQQTSGNSGEFYTVQQLRNIPSWLPAAFGWAFALSSLEVHRFPVIQAVVLDYSRITGIVTWIALLLVGLILWRTKSDMIKRPIFGIVMGVIAAAALFVFYSCDAESGTSSDIAQVSCCVFPAAIVGLLATWTRNLYEKPPLVGRLIFIASLPLVFILQLAVGFLTPEIARGACALFPAFSASLLLVLNRATPFSGQFFSRTDVENKADVLEKHQVRALILCAIAFMCYNVFYSQTHIDWIVLQPEWGAVPIQTCSALGSLIAAIALAVLLPTLRQNRNETLLCQVLVLSFALLSLCLGSMSHQSMALPFYLIALNTSQKIVMYLLFALGYCAGTATQRTALFLLLFAFYRTGFVVTSILGILLPVQTYESIQTVLLVGALAGAVLLMVVGVVDPATLPQNPIGNESETADDTDEKDSNSTLYKEIAFYFLFGQKYGLSQREIEVLPLLANHKTAREVADELCVSAATAKTHIRNIYTKLNVHSQVELIDLVEEQRSTLFDTLPSWYTQN